MTRNRSPRTDARLGAVAQCLVALMGCRFAKQLQLGVNDEQFPKSMVRTMPARPACANSPTRDNPELRGPCEEIKARHQQGIIAMKALLKQRARC